MKKENPNLIIGAVIQARMGSTRLQGKVLKDIAGKPMLCHLIDRLKFSKKINEIILAIPDTKENDALEKFAQKNKIKYFRGSEKDVLSRYYKSAKKFKCNVIIRITSDCPLIDSQIIDLMVEKYLNLKADFYSNVLKRTFPRGLDVEIFNFKSLEKSYKEAKKDEEREHPDEYMIHHPELFTQDNFKNKIDLSFMRWTVDEIRDLEFVREIYKRLYRKGKIFYMRDIVSLLKEYPELMEINKDVKQKLI